VPGHSRGAPYKSWRESLIFSGLRWTAPLNGDSESGGALQYEFAYLVVRTRKREGRAASGIEPGVVGIHSDKKKRRGPISPRRSCLVKVER
jgi:hypothetical protein